MPMVIPPGSYLAKLRWRLEGDPEEMICTLGITPTQDTGRTVEELAHAVYNAWDGAWDATTLDQGYTFVGVDVAAEGSGDGAPSGSWEEIRAGLNSSAALPQNCCILVKKKTPLSGHRNSGRMFLPAGYTAEVNTSATGGIDGSDLALMQANMDQFWENLRDESSPVGDVIMSLMPVLFHSVGSTDATEITKFVVDPIIATQRQRLRR